MYYFPFGPDPASPTSNFSLFERWRRAFWPHQLSCRYCGSNTV